MALLTLIIAVLIERYYHKNHRREGLAESFGEATTDVDSTSETDNLSEPLGADEAIRDKRTSTRKKLSSDNWFINYQLQINKLLAEQSWFSGWLKELILVLLPALVVYLLFNTLADHNFLSWLIMLALSVLVLVHCLGPETPRNSLKNYFSALDNQDEQGAYHHAEKFTGEQADDWSAMENNVARAIFRESQTRYFGVIFWFAFFGPAGALLYRLLHWYGRQAQFSAFARNLSSIMEWIPARVSALAFLLAGNMSGLAQIKGKLFDFDAKGLDLVEQAGLAAMGYTFEEKADEAAESGVEQEVEDGAETVLNSETSTRPLAETEVADTRQALDLSEHTAVILIAFVALISLLGWSFI